MHPNSLLLFQKYAVRAFRPKARVLEIGPDAAASLRRTLRGKRMGCWHTVDVAEGPVRLTFRASDPYRFPIEDDAYDVVVSANVIEHVPEVWRWIREVARVCRPGGTVITLNPVSWPFHAFPKDCWRIYPDGMRALYAHAGLSVSLARFESLESPGFERYVPGTSAEFRSVERRKVDAMLAALGHPFERAYDTITIGRKRRRRAPLR